MSDHLGRTSMLESIRATFWDNGCRGLIFEERAVLTDDELFIYETAPKHRYSFPLVCVGMNDFLSAVRGKPFIDFTPQDTQEFLAPHEWFSERGFLLEGEEPELGKKLIEENCERLLFKNPEIPKHIGVLFTEHPQALAVCVHERLLEVL